MRNARIDWSCQRRGWRDWSEKLEVESTVRCERSLEFMNSSARCHCNDLDAAAELSLRAAVSFLLVVFGRPAGLDVPDAKSRALSAARPESRASDSRGAGRQRIARPGQPTDRPTRKSRSLWAQVARIISAQHSSRTQSNLTDSDQTTCAGRPRCSSYGRFVRVTQPPP